MVTAVAAVTGLLVMAKVAVVAAGLNTEGSAKRGGSC